MAKLPDGSWYRIIQISSEPNEGTGQPWFSYFYEGKSLAEARRRMGYRRAWVKDGSLSQWMGGQERPVALVELRRMICEGEGYNEDAQIVELLDSWQSEVIQVYSPLESA